MFRWLDAVLRHEVRIMRDAYAKPIEEFQGLYVSDERVDQVLAADLVVAGRAGAHYRASNASDAHEREGEEFLDCDPDDAEDLLAQLVSQSSRWSRVHNSLALTAFDCAVLLLALAPEADLKYETVYAYLNNDISRKWPTRDLALRLFARLAGDQNIVRARLGSASPLFRSGLLKVVPSSGDHVTWRATGFVIEPMAAHALLDASGIDAYLPSACVCRNQRVEWGDVAVSAELLERLARLPAFFAPYPLAFSSELSDAERGEEFPLLVFEGRPGHEQKTAAAALATALDVPWLVVDMRLLPPSSSPEHTPDAIRLALLHQILYGSVLVIEGLDTLRETASASTAIRNIVTALSRARGPIILACDESAGQDLVDGFRALTFQFTSPTSVQRSRLWDAAATRYHLPLSPELRDTVASRFILTPGQIRRAAQSAADGYQLSATVGTVNSSEAKPQGAAYTSDQPLFEAARTQTRIALGALARRVHCVYTYEDLVLPPVTSQQVREIAAAIRSRGLVYEDWGFAKRLPQGQGLKVLFSGASGTGKTMAAAVIAREVGLDLYAIDLSGIVSKYIGETEKNLDRVFRAAHCANAILFFDECDALFGKRSEVKDAHDRYANIEVAYLLQKMEAHEGAVILATNFSRNMDQAFARRMQYVVEFPIPDEVHREQLWRGMFPEHTPLSDDVDFSFLARQFPIAGGDIRNVVLDAAFLAAQNGRVITMQHLIRAMARQVVKQGRSPSPTEFKHYFTLLSRDS